MTTQKRTALDWIAIEGAYRAGVESVRAIAETHGISETAIRKKAKALGWSRDPTGTKRAIVNAALAFGSHEGSQDALRTLTSEAAFDIADMERGIRIHRHCLMALEDAAQTAREPKEIKVIVEATGLAITSIRTIRGLNDPEGKERNADDESRAEAIARRLEQSEPAAESA